MPLPLLLPNLGMGASAQGLTRIRTLSIPMVALSLSAADVVALKIKKISGTPVLRTKADASEITLKKT